MARGLAEEHGDENPVIASASEAIHRPVVELDCFVALLLAMTVAQSR
jgi:hypothetical protein